MARCQRVETRGDRLPHRDAVGIAGEGKRAKALGDMERRAFAILPLDRERARPDVPLGRQRPVSRQAAPMPTKQYCRAPRSQAHSRLR